MMIPPRSETGFPPRGLFAPRGLAVLGQLFVVQAFLLLSAGCSPQQEAGDNPEVARNVRVLGLSSQTLVEYFEVSGPVSPVLGTDVSVEEAGLIIALPVDKGQAVVAGQLLLELDRTILLAEMESAASLLKMQDFNIDKVRTLYKAGKVSRLELLTNESQYEQARAQAAVTGQRYHRAALSAPFDGILTDRFVEIGQLVLPGQMVLRLIDPHVLKLEAYLTGTEVGWVRVGDHAEISLGERLETAQGKVSWVGLEADRMTGKFRMEIEIPNQELKHHSGIIGRARLPKRTLSDALVIPRVAVLHDSAGVSAYIIQGDHAVLRRLVLGADQGSLVVVEKGLESGDQLVVRGHRDLRDGSLVKVTETSVAIDGSLTGDPDHLGVGVEVSR
ncbi:MAG: efflux RND transporter periplasmic adaptor subunit [Gemmatimonadales bacterium]|nr:efflux RND transporter periplasmic adaptor subunit [Gemmatimonadales bacterium]